VHQAKFKPAASLLGTVLLAWAAAAADATSYRLAGIIDLGTQVLAVVELPQGSQVTLSAGDTIDDFQVMAIERRSLILQRGAEQVVLTLAGGSAAVAQVQAAQAATVISHTVDTAALERLSSLRGESARSEGDLLAALTDALDLPVGTRISRAGGVVTPQAAGAARDVIERLYDRLASGDPAKLYLDGSAVEEIYLLPDVTGG
jgi:hypothetical protein